MYSQTAQPHPAYLNFLCRKTSKCMPQLGVSRKPKCSEHPHKCCTRVTSIAVLFDPASFVLKDVPEIEISDASPKFAHAFQTSACSSLLLAFPVAGQPYNVYRNCPNAPQPIWTLAAKSFSSPAATNTQMLPHGLEPWTSRLLAERSNQLSYESSCMSAKTLSELIAVARVADRVLRLAPMRTKLCARRSALLRSCFDS